MVALCFIAFALGAGLALINRDAVADTIAEVIGPDLPQWTRSEPVTVLILGTDKREDEAGPSRSDTLMLAMFDPANKHVALLSIPRDLWVTIPGHGESRINTAYFRGQAQNPDNGGPGLAMLTVQYNFGVPVDYWVSLDFRGFERIIDALGGITVDVPYEIIDTAYPDGSYGTYTLHIPAGEQQMDGARALEYARTRHGSSDFDRARRQQQIVAAVKERALSAQMLPRLPRIAQTLADAVQTNAEPTTALALAGLARQMQDVTLEAQVIDEKLAANYITASGAYVLLPDWDGIHALVGQLFAARLGEGQPLAGAAIRVENATDLPGLASQTAAYLETQGAAITAVTDRGSTSEATLLYVYAPAPEATRHLMSLLRLSDEQVIAAEGGPPGTQMTLVLGWDLIAGD